MWDKICQLATDCRTLRKFSSSVQSNTLTLVGCHFGNVYWCQNILRPTDIYNATTLMLINNISNIKKDPFVEVCFSVQSIRQAQCNVTEWWVRKLWFLWGCRQQQQAGLVQYYVSQDDDIMTQWVGGKEQNNNHSSLSTSGSVTQTLIDLSSHFLTATLE